MYIYYNLFIYSSISEHKCCYVLAIINNAVINIGVQTSFWVSNFISFGFIPRSRTARSDDSSIFNYLRNFHTICHSGYINLYSYQMHIGFPFLHNLICDLIILMMAIRAGIRWHLILILICIFLLLVMLSIFSCTCWSVTYLLWRNIYSVPLPIFCFLFCFLCCCFSFFLLIIKAYVLKKMIHLYYFLKIFYH